MEDIRKYIHMVNELIEKPMIELRHKVVTNQGKAYADILKKYEKAYMEKCLKIEELLDREMNYSRRFKRID